MSTDPKVWFVTGTSTGFGAALARELLNREHLVIATARSLSKLSTLESLGAHILPLDVTSPPSTLADLAKQAHALHGRIDFLVNNAGYELNGTIEEATAEEIRAQFDTNVFGTLNVTKAFLPYFREQRSGCVVNISSVGAWRGTPGMGIYEASKWALSGLSECMNRELAPFNIKVCSVEPGSFRSSILASGNRRVVEGRISDYGGSEARSLIDVMASKDGKQPGDVGKAVRVMVDVFTEEGGEVPVRLPLGRDSYETIKRKCEETLGLLEGWRDVICATDHDDVGTLGAE
jgi:NAD(P)-dependent dehydrogenase (short-subunit alcohol dehydrogenase family)